MPIQGHIKRDPSLHFEKMDTGKIRFISLLAFVMGFSQALFAYVMSSYFKLSWGSENVGVFYLVSYVISLSILLNLHKIVKRTGKADVFHFSLVFKIVALAFLLAADPGPAGILLVMGYIIFGNAEWASLDMILESHSSDSMSGRIRGKFLTVMNAGVLVGPFFSTRILEKYDYYGIFLALFAVNVLISIAAIWNLKRTRHKIKESLSVKEVLKKAVKRKNVRKVFYVSFVVEFFYALMIIYTPIHLLNLGMGWGDIGAVFTVMLVPFVILQYPAGILADKRMGEKELLIFSVLIIGFSTLSIFFIESADVILWSVVLFATRIGIALAEILRDSYFYKRIDGYDVDLINIFRTAKPAAYILGSALSVPLLMIFPVKAVFVLVALVVLSALWPALKIQDNRSEKEAVA